MAVSKYKLWMERHPDDYRAKKDREMTRYREARATVLFMYGGACVCCGSDYPAHLTLDHVNGGGTQARKQEGSKTLTWRLFRALPSLDPEFQVMCFNCNHAKHTQGSCGCGEG